MFLLIPQVRCVLFSRNNGPFGQSNTFSSYPTYAYDRVQTSSLIGKVMGLLAFSFLFAFIGTFVGFFTIQGLATYWIVALGGLVVLFALQLLIQRPGINLFLLYLFTFLEGMSLAPLISHYLYTNGNILGEAFLITALTSLALGLYAWTTRRDFSRLGDYLFFGLILLLIASVVGLFFGSFFSTGLGGLVISVIGVAIFSGYMLFYVQRAKNMPDTMPNAILLTVSLFITILNLFLYILRILAILQGGERRR